LNIINAFKTKLNEENQISEELKSSIKDKLMYYAQLEHEAYLTSQQ